LACTPIEETLTMWPKPRSRMCGSSAMIILIAPK
jgi:hypothetical protein